MAKRTVSPPATFAAMSLYGYTTGSNLSGVGSFFFMGLVGILIAGLVNIFLQSPARRLSTAKSGTPTTASHGAADRRRTIGTTPLGSR